MRYISYRSKLRLRNTLIIVLAAVLVLVLSALCAFFYLERYIVYTPEGAKLDFNAPAPGASPVREPAGLIPGAALVEDEGEQDTQAAARISGFYADGPMLADPEAVHASLQSIDAPTSVLLDVRSIYGNFYYPSGIEGAQTSSAVDPSAVRGLIRELSGNENVHLIAWLPAFRDSTYALSHHECGLSLPSGALWMDGDGCYWLDPANDKVIAYLELAGRELAALGFDEVVFADFYFPEGAAAYYEGDPAATITEAARRLQANLTGLTVSLSTPDATLTPFAERVYFKESDGAQVPSLTAPFRDAYSPLSDHLVFLTDSRDTRFEEFCVLKPAVGGNN